MPGKRVALLEFDLRSPGISKKIGLNNTRGISNYLSGQSDNISDMYHIVENIPTLHIYTSGPIPSNPADLLLDEKCQTLFKTLKKQYDYIIVDTPPTGFVIDTFILGAYSDAAIYIVKQRHTLKKQLDYINEIYRTQKLTNMGLLINDIKNSKTHGYGYGKGYGYPYGETKRGLLSRVFHPNTTISATTLSFKKKTPINGTHYNNNLVK
jgi:capsular exopolysaccharide synthesis family protein